MSVESILGQYEANLKAQTNTDRVATDKNTFLKLLVAQLTHQDPLNPVEDKEFIAQLAQFTSVEELQNLNGSMTELNAAYQRQQATTAASMIGLYVAAQGDNLTLTGSGTDKAWVSPITYTLPSNCAEVRVAIHAMNADGSQGNMVYSANLGPQSAGTHNDFNWLGVDGNGVPVPDGAYMSVFYAVDDYGNSIPVTTTSMGIVRGLQIEPDGNHKLSLEDGRMVNFNDVEIIVDPRYLNGGGNGGNNGNADNEDDGAAPEEGTGGEDNGDNGDGDADAEGGESGDSDAALPAAA